MTVSLAVSALSGWSIGYTLGSAHQEEMEIEQGKNFYLSSLCQVAEVGALGAFGTNFSSSISKPVLRVANSIFCNIAPFLWLPVGLLCAGARAGEYNMIRNRLRHISWMPELPDLSARTVGTLSQISKHAGRVFQVALVVGALACVFFGKLALGCGALAGIAYSLIPRDWMHPKIARVLEKVLPVINYLGMLLNGSVTGSLFGGLMLVSSFSIGAKKFLIKRVDDVFNYIFPSKDKKLDQIDAFVEPQLHLSYTQIQEILMAPASCFDVNPAHCAKKVFTNLLELDSNGNFEELYKLFKSVDWKGKFPVVIKKLSDDERFLYLLKENGIQCKPGQFKQALAELAVKYGKTSEEFALQWLDEQMHSLVQVLLGKKVARGSQIHIVNVESTFAHILAYLRSLDPKKDAVEMEDMLLKLAVEAGDYCSLGMKVTANELQAHIMQTKLEQLGTSDVDPQDLFQVKLTLQLLLARQHIFQSYVKMMNDLFRASFNGFADDVHVHNLIEAAFGYGFIPLDSVQEEMVFGELYGNWKIYGFWRELAYSEYKDLALTEVIKAVGKVNVAPFLIHLIRSNKKLTDQEKQAFVDEYANVSSYSEQSYLRLMYCMLGVFTFKK